MIKAIVNKITIVLLSLLGGYYIFNIGVEAALQSRGYKAYGGEFFLIFFPILLYLLAIKVESILKKGRKILKERTTRKMEDDLKKLLPGAREIEKYTDKSKLRFIGAVKNDAGCIKIYKEKEEYWKEQIRYKTLSDGRIVPTKEPIVKRQYRKRKPMPQCY